jgi:hypothetical protein
MATIEQQDKMSKEEKAAYDAQERAREQAEQAGELPLFDSS